MAKKIALCIVASMALALISGSVFADMRIQIESEGANQERGEWDVDLI